MFSNVYMLTAKVSALFSTSEYPSNAEILESEFKDFLFDGEEIILDRSYVSLFADFDGIKSCADIDHLLPAGVDVRRLVAFGQLKGFLCVLS